MNPGSFRQYFDLLRHNNNPTPLEIRNLATRLVRQDVFQEGHQTDALFLYVPDKRTLVFPHHIELQQPSAQPTDARAFMLKLPTEVLTQIFDEVYKDNECEDACAFALTCKPFAVAGKLGQNSLLLTPYVLNNMIPRPDNTRYCPGCRKSRLVYANYTRDLHDWLHPPPGSNFIRPPILITCHQLRAAYKAWFDGRARLLPDGRKVLWCPPCMVQFLFEDRCINYRIRHIEEFLDNAMRRGVRDI